MAGGSSQGKLLRQQVRVYVWLPFDQNLGVRVNSLISCFWAVYCSYQYSPIIVNLTTTTTTEKALSWLKIFVLAVSLPHNRNLNTPLVQQGDMIILSWRRMSWWTIMIQEKIFEPMFKWIWKGSNLMKKFLDAPQDMMNFHPSEESFTIWCSSI